MKNNNNVFNISILKKNYTVMILLSEQKYDQQNRYLETRKNIYVVSALSFIWSIREKQNTDEQKLLLTAVYIQTKR